MPGRKYRAHPRAPEPPVSNLKVLALMAANLAEREGQEKELAKVLAEFAIPLMSEEHVQRIIELVEGKEGV